MLQLGDKKTVDYAYRVLLNLIVVVVSNFTVFGVSLASEPMRSIPGSQHASRTVPVTDNILKKFRIAPGPLTSALTTFTKESGIPLEYDSVLIEGRKTQGLAGSFSADDALHRLLDGTGLSRQPNQVGLIRVVQNSDEALGGERENLETRSMNERDVQSRTIRKVKLSEVVVRENRETQFVAEDAQSATKTNTPLIETPQSITVITRNRIVKQEIDSMAEALRYTAGVQSDTFGYEPRFTWLRFRGFDSTTDGIFKDGLKLRNPGFAISVNLEPYGAEQVDVLRGPGSFLYGQGSPGGLLNYISKRPTRKSLREVQFLAGNFQRYEGRLDFGGRLFDSDAVTFRLTGLVRESGTQVDRVPNDRVYLAPALTYHVTPNTRITFFADFQKDELGSSQALPAEGTVRFNPNGRIPASRFTAIRDIEKQNRTEWSSGYELHHAFSEHWRVLQKFRYNSMKLDGFGIFSSAFGADKRTVSRGAFGSVGSLDAISVDNQVHGYFSTGPLTHTLLAGLDFQRITVDLTQTFGAASDIDIFNRDDFGGSITAPPPVFLDEETTQWQLGTYLQDQIKIFEKIIVTVGGRYDWAKDDTKNILTRNRQKQKDQKATTRLALSYLFDIGLAPYVSYSTFFLPSIGVNPSGDEFKPEKGRQYEAGIKYQPPGSRSLLAIAIFDLTRENFIQTDPASFLSAQRGEARSRGVELEAILSFDLGVDVIANFTVLENEIQKTVIPTEKGKRLTQTPAQFGSVWINYTVPEGPAKGFMVGGGARYTGYTYSDAANTFRVPSFVVGDAVVAYTWDRFRFAVNVTNILDHEQFSCFSRGATNFCNYGQRRSVVGSLTTRW